MYLFVDDNEESREARKLLKEMGVNFKEIDVSKGGVRGWMLLEFGAMEAPVMVTPSAVFMGLESIKKYLSNGGFRHELSPGPRG